MTLRERVRRWRLYYRSRPLFQEMLARPSLAWRLPWMRAQRSVEVRFRTGRTARLRAGQWPLLPSACRLERIGAEYEFLDDAKRVRIDGLTMYSPLWTRDEAAYYREVFLDDVYGIRGRDLSGRVVVDVGAYVGDSAIAFARRGAHVHAFEPAATFCGFIRRNLAANRLAERVTLHEVGLGERDEYVDTRHDRLHLVEGVQYALAHLPPHVELLKLDCEGAEYHLLSDARFLRHLAPRQIRMEYHRGLDPVRAALAEAGYAIEVLRPGAVVGLLSAVKR